MTDQQKTEWAMYFATIVGMQLHPGYSRENVTALTLEECAEMADKMMALSSERGE